MPTVRCHDCLGLNQYNPRDGIFKVKKCQFCGHHSSITEKDIVLTRLERSCDEKERISELGLQILELFDTNPTLTVQTIKEETHANQFKIFYTNTVLEKKGLVIKHTSETDKRHYFLTRTEKPLPDVEYLPGQSRVHNVKVIGNLVNRPETLQGVELPNFVTDVKEYPMKGWSVPRIIIYFKHKFFGNIEINQNSFALNMGVQILTWDIERTKNLILDSVPEILTLFNQLGIRTFGQFTIKGHMAFKGFTMDIPPHWWTDHSEGQREAETDSWDEGTAIQQFRPIFERMWKYFRIHILHEDWIHFQGICKLRRNGTFNFFQFRDALKRLSSYPQFVRERGGGT